MRRELKIGLFVAGVAVGLGCAGGGRWMKVSEEHGTRAAPQPGIEAASVAIDDHNGQAVTRMTLVRATDQSTLSFEVDGAPEVANPPQWTSPERVELVLDDVTITVATTGK